MRIFTILKSLTLVVLMTSPGMSQDPVIESFDYPNGASLDTLLGTAGDGWAGCWDHFDLNEGMMFVVDSGIVYEDLDYEVPMRGLNVRGTNLAAWGGQRYGRYLAQEWPDEAGKEYWLSCIMELSYDYTANGWALVSMYDSTAELAGIGHGWGNDSLGLATGTPEGRTEYTCQDGPQWFVARVIMSGDTLPERVFLWASPDPEGSEPDTAIADARGNWGLNNGFNRVAVHWGGEGVGEVQTFSVDEIRLGTSWEDVSSPIITGVSRQDNKLPVQFALSQNYPNPFNPTTKISYTIANSGKIRLSVYDPLGREVAELVNKVQNAASYEVPFSGAGLSSGIYFYKLQTTDQAITKKMMLIK